MTAASRFQRANGSTGSGLSALGGVERSESGAYRGPFGAAGEDPDHDYAAVMTGEAPGARCARQWHDSQAPQGVRVVYVPLSATSTIGSAHRGRLSC